jgi:hypothetical protein
VGLVVRRVDYGHPVRLKAIAESQPRVIQILANDSDIAYQEGSFDEFVVVDRGTEPLQADEIGILHLAPRVSLRLFQATGA